MTQLEDVLALFQDAGLDQEVAEFADLLVEPRREPVLAIELVILDVWEHAVTQAEHLVERAAFLVAVEVAAVFITDAFTLRLQFLRVAENVLAGFDATDVMRQGGERDRHVVVPAAVVIIESVARRDVEPGIACLVQRVHPLLAGLAFRLHRIQRLRRLCAIHECAFDAEVDRELCQLLEFVVGAEHQYVDARYHSRDGLVRDFGERLLAELEEHQVGPVAEHQELEVVVPHHRVALDAAVPRLANVMVQLHDLGVLRGQGVPGHL